MKKYILFIVEGKNDKTEIQAILRAGCGKSFSDNFVDAYHVHNGDITTEKDTTEKNIVGKLSDIVISWRNGGEQPFHKIMPADVFKIIHIVDTDGVFIPEESIIQTDDAKTKYHDDSINCMDPNVIIGRNRKKSKVLRRLIDVSQIDNIPYELYFASCNMDHLLFDERNPSSAEKNRHSMQFAVHCKNREFIDETVLTPDVCTIESYFESWEVIQYEYNSLQRFTNINLMLDGIRRNPA